VRLGFRSECIVCHCYCSTLCILQPQLLTGFTSSRTRRHRSLLNPHVKCRFPILPPHHTTITPHSEQSGLVELDNKPTTLDRVDEDVAAGESEVAPSADEFDLASSGSLYEESQYTCYSKEDLGYRGQTLSSSGWMSNHPMRLMFFPVGSWATPETSSTASPAP
jgi:hypothetical protein